MGAADANRILALFEEMKCFEKIALEETLKKATVRTGLFKRRIVHVARRFGALEKWVDLSKVTLGNLSKSFDGTAIYEEALKEVFTRDLDLEKMVSVLTSIKNGEIVVKQLENKGVATPIARVGLEKASMKTDLIPPERIKRIIIAATRARLLSEVQTVICTECWEYLEMIRMKDLPDKPTCPRCGSLRLGLLTSDARDAQPLLYKAGEKLTKGEERMRNHAFNTSRLVAEYGKPAAIALSGRRLSVSDVKGILEKTRKVSNHFFELVIDAERSALKRRFW
jgi:ATP-dependent Lhr-like helicase